MFGALSINKPAGWTSRDVVNRIQGMVRPHKVGHTGTLDPMATGVLLLAIGSASRLVEFSLGHSKSYEADFEFGLTSDSLDTQGNVEALDVATVPTREDFDREAAHWIGRVQQVPPKYSAINVGGRRAYDLARKGKEFELAARTIVIHDIEIIDFHYPRWTMRVDCGSGTYIRSLGSDIASALGSDAVMSRLVRTRVGPFELKDCAELEKLATSQDIEDSLHPPHRLLANMPFVVLDVEQARQIRHGIPLRLDGPVEDRLAAVDARDDLIAILQRASPCESPNVYRSLRVFQTASDTSQPKPSNRAHKPES